MNTEERIGELLNLHRRASADGDAQAEHDIYDDAVVCDYPQPGERILGRNNLQPTLLVAGAGSNLTAQRTCHCRAKCPRARFGTPHRTIVSFDTSMTIVRKTEHPRWGSPF